MTQKKHPYTNIHFNKYTIDRRAQAGGSFALMNKSVSDLSCEFEVKSEDANVATFTGVASTNDVDSDNDIIEAGCFEPIPMKTAPNGDEMPNVLMLRDHNRSEIIGGWRSFKQNGSQLVVHGELALEVPRAKETHALMKRGYLSGLSVCFQVKDASQIAFNQSTGRRHIKKALLKEVSIVGFPANTGARITAVKTEIDQWLFENGLEEADLLQMMHEAKRGDPKKPWGDVDYADPGYQEDGVHRYPIHTERNIRAAWSYINMPRNQAPYTRDQVAKIKARIVAAWKDKIDPKGPPAHQEREGKSGTIPSGMRAPREDEPRGSWMSYCIGELRDQGFTGDERMAICMRAFREGERPRTTKHDGDLILGIDGHTRIDQDQAAAQLRELLAQVKGRVP